MVCWSIVIDTDVSTTTKMSTLLLPLGLDTVNVSFCEGHFVGSVMQALGSGGLPGGFVGGVAGLFRFETLPKASSDGMPMGSLNLTGAHDARVIVVAAAVRMELIFGMMGRMMGLRGTSCFTGRTLFRFVIEFIGLAGLINTYSPICFSY
jgi:hypothetical protein